MKPGSIFFYSSSLFLIGVFLASVFQEWGSRFWIIIGITLLLGALFLLLGRYWMAALSIFLVIGYGHVVIVDQFRLSSNLPVGQKAELTGFVAKAEQGMESQELIMAIRESYNGRLKIFTSKYPAYKYGDVLKIDGKVEEIPEEYKNSYLKNGIVARMRNPKITPTGENEGFWLKRGLFSIRDFVRDSFYKVLSPERAAFLSGLILGDTSGFTKEFREKLSLTGTSHLVALSGYNVAIIIDAIGLALAGRVSRRTFFVLTVVIILGFVVMTGAEASVVRAAIMASLLLLANQIGRIHNFRNALALAALLMVLANPRVLVWDIGFQLSFAALLGIVYLAPALRKLVRAKEEPGILNWRQNLFATLSAQLAVLPILLSSFGTVSAMGLLTNMLLLSAIPLTMFFGFMVAFAAVISGWLAQALAWLVSILLTYELTVIDWFSKLGGVFEVVNFNWFYGVLYWAALIGLVYYAEQKFQSKKV
ncbi:MAG: competence protein ComEC [Parcubacteria group bacterium Gr01-1014_3]|nr:MAG: competence protein ComEC [Parcubacteria group bacterium Gr01-1014_3]